MTYDCSICGAKFWVGENYPQIQNYVQSFPSVVSAQIYIHDGTPEAEVDNRQRHLGEAKLPEQMLHEVSPYASYFKHAVDLMREQGGIDVRMIIRADGRQDHRRYNLPTAPWLWIL